MSIVIDKQVISSPRITGAISTQGIIEGIPPTEVDDLAIQLKAGALAVPLVLVESRIVPAVATVPTPVASGQRSSTAVSGTPRSIVSTSWSPPPAADGRSNGQLTR